MPSALIGYTCCAVAGVGFGTNYLPVKRVDVGDGVFFATSMTPGICAIGVVASWIMGSSSTLPAFEPLAAVAGAIWMMGNLMTTFVIKVIGLGLGLIMWDLSNMLIGWATGRFGLFGIHVERVSRPGLNYLGLALAAASLIFFTLAAHEDEKAAEPENAKVTEPDVELSVSETSTTTSNVSTAASTATNNADLEAKQPSSRSLPTKPSALKFALGCAAAILAGIFFGTTFDLPTDLMQGDFGGHHSRHVMDYVFSHFLGILIMAMIALLVYISVNRSKSYLPWKAAVPATFSGALWGVAQVAWFHANVDLSFLITFPIISTLPGVIALLVGFFFCGELRVRRARYFAIIGLCLRVPGVLLIALSN